VQGVNVNATTASSDAVTKMSTVAKLSNKVKKNKGMKPPPKLMRFITQVSFSNVVLILSSSHDFVKV
jgi:hypothetical protein